MLITSFLDRFKRARRFVEPKPDYVGKHSYVVTDDHKLSIQADSLDSFYASEDRQSSAQRLLGIALKAQSYGSLDGSEADFDPRPGHIVAPSRYSEYHPDEHGGFAATVSGSQVQSDGQVITVTPHLPNAKTETAAWNPQKNQLDYTYTSERSPVHDVRGSHNSLLESADFTIAADGTIKAPVAYSLEQATEAESKRRLAKRTAEIIEAGKFWMDMAQQLDGKAGDVNPAQGALVAPHLRGDALQKKAGSQEQVLFGDQLLNSRRSSSAVETIAIEAKGNQFSVFARARDNYADPQDASFKGSLDEGVLTLDFKSPRNSDYQDRVVWNQAEGTVHFENLRGPDSRYYSSYSDG
jgi:hypothetical protein